MVTTSHQITINAPKEFVFEAITTPQGLKNWYTPSVKGEASRGGEMVLEFTDKEGPFRWKVQEQKENSLVQWKCVEGPGNAAGTVATFKLSDKGQDKTIVEFDHEGFQESDSKLKTCNTLWGILMHHLKQYSETKQPQPAFQ